MRTVPDDIPEFLRLSKTIRCTNMHLFTPEFPSRNAVIKKYVSVDDIVKDFYDMRIQGYVLRKKHQLEKLSFSISLLEEKKKFVRMVIDGDVSVFRTPMKDIVHQLMEHGFREQSGSYQYLTDMKLSEFSEDRIRSLDDILCKEREKKQNLEAMTEKDIWVSELDELSSHL